MIIIYFGIVIFISAIVGAVIGNYLGWKSERTRIYKILDVPPGYEISRVSYRKVKK